MRRIELARAKRRARLVNPRRSRAQPPGQQRGTGLLVRLPGFRLDREEVEVGPGEVIKQGNACDFIQTLEFCRGHGTEYTQRWGRLLASGRPTVPGRPDTERGKWAEVIILP